ncbi:MAG TPA: hypothetical protein VMH61_08275 [Candidatus Acidoferrales bacterium]|nr:hypothetical protein [Candidatus Acidoferrales bacterium]
MPHRPPLVSLLLLLALVFAPRAHAQVITLDVDATQAPRRLLRVIETFPVKPGTISLAYPKWIPGEHGPTGPVTDVMNLVMTANGQRLSWQRDDVEPYVVRCLVPGGASELRVTFDFALASTTSGYSSAASSTDNLVLLSWNQVLLYPAGQPSDAIAFRASLLLPDSWSYATALHTTGSRTGRLDFAQVSLTRLVDSPVLAGRYFRHIDLAPGSPTPYSMELACDSPAGLDVPDSTIEAYRRLVHEAHVLFGGRHHDEYHFLVTLSDHTAHFGLEHHECSDDRAAERTWVDDDLRLAASGLFSHEFVHSWNGKYRRPAGLATADYGQPMKGELLWVYEGLTQYLGWVLSGRSGIRTTQQSLDELARIAANQEAIRGREWRPLEDTAVEAARLYDSRGAWQFERRGTDFYDEGLLLWLEADVTIRRLTNGAKSIDDFCHAFHGGIGPAELKPYTFDDVVHALNEVAPYDWATFLHDHLDRVQAHAPMGGIRQGGWALAFKDSATAIGKSREAARNIVDESQSIGLIVSTKDDGISDVVPGSAADKAGIAPEMHLVAVNGRAWSKNVLRDAIRATKSGGSLELLVRNDDFFRTCRLDYRDGLRFPVLQRSSDHADIVSQILAPHAGAGDPVR